MFLFGILLLVIDISLSFPWTQKLYKYNPLIQATSPSTPKPCEENIYSQEIHILKDNSFILLYGGWEGEYSDGHDRIYLASSIDLVNWRKYPSDANPQPILEHGSANHVNDPTLIWIQGKWKMYYTDAINDQDDRVWLAESTTLTHFDKVKEVVSPGQKGEWNEVKVGRPAVQEIYPNGTIYLWYDGAGPRGRCVGLSISTDYGDNFIPYSGNPLFCGGGGIDVKKIGDTFYMTLEGRDGIHIRVSKDGISWMSEEVIIHPDGQDYDKYGLVVPSIFVHPSRPNEIHSFWAGGARVNGWDRNNIAVSWSENATVADGAGCTGCTSRNGGVGCVESCGKQTGICGNPGSKDPGHCCACSAEPCGKCLAGFDDCHLACTAMKKTGGWCAHPGSTDPNNCCACFEPVGFGRW